MSNFHSSFFISAKQLFRFVQQLLYCHVFTLISLFVEEQDERDATELELLLQVTPFAAGDEDMLATDFVGFEER